MNLYKEDMNLFQSSVRPLRSIYDELKVAIEGRDQFAIRYQPIVESGTGKVELAEALLRWTSPVLGEVSPERFICIAEQYGLIRRLTRLVLRKVCEDISKFDDLIVSVNVSTMDIKDPQFPEEVSQILSDYGVSPQRVILECTDSISSDVAYQAAQTLHKLRKLGHAVAIYELESGFTSFGFLEMHGYTLLKVDKTLIHEALENATSRANLQEVVKDSNAKGFKSLAFGVETAEQAAAVEEMGFDFQQGFYHSLSLSIDELAHFSSNRTCKPVIVNA